MKILTPQARIDAIRQIVTECTCAKVDGVLIDLFSAGAIIAVYDALDDKNKAKFTSLPVYKMAGLALKLINQQGRPQ